MAQNPVRLEELPTLTGTESQKDKLDRLYTYIFLLREQLTYLLSNLCNENFNPSAWKKMQEDIADQILQKMISEDGIGQEGEDLHLRGNVYINGVLYEPEGGTK